MTIAKSLDFMFNGAKVITFMEGDKPWFIARTVAEAIGYNDPDAAVRKHCDDTRVLSKREQEYILDRVSNRGVLAIDEGDVYRLILKSRQPKAKAFERWVCNEILPSIRKTGSYSLEDVENAKREAAATAIATNPVILGYAQICDTDGSFSITEAAKANGITQTEMFESLHAWKWVYKRGPNSQWIPYASLPEGLLVVKVIMVPNKNSKPRSIIQTRVTPEGVARIATILNREKLANPSSNPSSNITKV